MSRLPAVLPVTFGGHANTLPVTLPLVFGTEFVESNSLPVTADPVASAGFLITADCELSATATTDTGSELTKYCETSLWVSADGSADTIWIPNEQYGDLQVTATASAEVTRSVTADSSAVEITAGVDSEASRYVFGDSDTQAEATASGWVHRDLWVDSDVEVTAESLVDFDDLNFATGLLDVSSNFAASASVYAPADSSLDVSAVCDPDQTLESFGDVESQVVVAVDSDVFRFANVDSDLSVSTELPSGVVLSAIGQADLAVTGLVSVAGNASLIAGAVETAITVLAAQIGNVLAGADAGTVISASITASDSTNAVAQAATSITAAVNGNVNSLAVAQSLTAVTATDQATISSQLVAAAATQIQVEQLAYAVAQKFVTAQTAAQFLFLFIGSKPLIWVSVKPDIRSASVTAIDHAVAVPVAVRDVDVLAASRRSAVPVSARSAFVPSDSTTVPAPLGPRTVSAGANIRTTLGTTP